MKHHLIFNSWGTGAVSRDCFRFACLENQAASIEERRRVYFTTVIINKDIKVKQDIQTLHNTDCFTKMASQNNLYSCFARRFSQQFD